MIGEQVPILFKFSKIIIILFWFWNQQGGAKYKVAANIYTYISKFYKGVYVYIDSVFTQKTDIAISPFFHDLVFLNVEKLL